MKGVKHDIRTARNGFEATTVRMAAQAKRISDELYQIASEYKTPLEEYMDGENTDGFEKVETITPAESEE